MKAIYTFLLAAILSLGYVVMSAQHASASTVPRRLIALRWAERQAGKPYVFGGTGPWGFDCSGLVQAAYRHAGMWIPRTTFSMLASSRLVRVSASAVKRGDLAFYGSGHVELVTRRGTFGALQLGDPVGWHHPSGGWFPTMYFRIS